MSKYSVRSNFRFKDCTSRSTFSCLVLTAEAFMTSALQKEISGNAIFDLGRRNMDWWKSTSRHKILQEQSFFPEPFDRVEEHQTHRPLLCISRKIESENWSHLVLSSFCTCFRMWYSWPSGQLFRMGKSLSFSPCKGPNVTLPIRMLLTLKEGWSGATGWKPGETGGTSQLLSWWIGYWRSKEKTNEEVGYKMAHPPSFRTTAQTEYVHWYGLSDKDATLAHANRYMLRIDPIVQIY